MPRLFHLLIQFGAHLIMAYMYSSSTYEPVEK